MLYVYAHNTQLNSLAHTLTTPQRKRVSSPQVQLTQTLIKLFRTQ